MTRDLRLLTKDAYPLGLREIPGAPRELHIRGELAPKGTKYLAVVGSRALSPYGREMCESLIQGLSGHPISIVSGLALGADAAAHEAALATGLHTVAVLASGIHDSSISPRTNAPLAARILETGGALVSENPPDYSPFPSDFPKRNRIVAGLADAILIIEAGERSGTLITARLASEYNRDLMCVPHRANDPGGYGAHLFIRLGAALVSEPRHILEALGLSEEPKDEEYQLSEGEELVLSILENPHTKEELILKAGMNESELLSALVMLELKGKVEQKFGTWRRVF